MQAAYKTEVVVDKALRVSSKEAEQYRINNKDKIKEDDKQYTIANREKIRAKQSLASYIRTTR
jgi:hypothetical protein